MVAPVNTVSGAGAINEEETLHYNGAFTVIDDDSATLTITMSVEHGTLTFNASGLTSIMGNGTAMVTFTGSLVTLQVTTLAMFDYTPDANYVGTDAVTMVSDDGTDTDTDISGLITILNVNDAPVLDPAATPVLNLTDLDAPIPIGAVGTLVSDLVDLDTDPGGLDNVSDIDPSPLTGIAVIGADGSNGTWYYSTDDGAMWQTLGAPTDAAARLLAPEDRLYFKPNMNYLGTATVTFRAWDQTSGTAGLTANASVNGNTTAFSTATDTATVTVSDFNSSPINLVPGASVVNEDETLHFNGAFSILDDSTSLTVTLSVSHGTLSINPSGLVFSVGDGTDDATMTFSGSKAAIDAQLMFIDYTPDPDFNGTDVVLMTSSDGEFSTGPTSSGDITVLPVNDAPVLDPAATPVLDPQDLNAPLPIGLAGTRVSALVDLDSPMGGLDNVHDVDASPVTGIAIVGADQSNGSFYYSINDGATWQLIGPVAEASARLLDPDALLYFAPNAAYTGSASITFRAWDQSSGINGSTVAIAATGTTTAFSVATDTASVTVLDINDAPVVTITAPLLPIVDQTGYNNSAYDIANIRAEAFSLAGTTALNHLTVYLVDGSPTPDNGLLDFFNGTLGWAIYANDGSDAPVGAPLLTGEDANPLLTDTGANHGGADIVVAQIDLGGASLPAGDYWFALREGSWLSPFDGSTIFWLGTITDMSGIGSALSDQLAAPDGTFLGQAHSQAYALDQLQLAATENLALNLKGKIAIADPDAGAGDLTVTLSVDYGILNVSAGASGASIDSGNGTGTVVVSGTLGELLLLFDTDATSVVEFVANTDTPPSSAALTVTANDNGNSGVDGAKQDSAGVTIEIVPVNDAPSGADKTVTTDEDTPYVFALADFGFSDVDGNAFSGVVIESLPAAGTLELNGVAVNFSDFISATDITNGLLAFVPAADGNGLSYASFNFGVKDDGGTANGGVDTDPTPNTMTIDVTDVNDAPTVTFDPTVTTNTAVIAFDQSGLDLSNQAPITSYVSAENFSLAGPTFLSMFTVYLGDNAINDNGVLDSFGGTLSWAIYEDNGANLPGAFVISGNDASPVLVDTGLQAFGSDLFEATIDLGGVDLAAGNYWIALHEGTWLSPSDGSEVWWNYSSNDATGIAVAATLSVTAPDGTFGLQPATLAFTLESTALLATEQVALDLKGVIEIDDVDAGAGQISVVVSVDYGILNITPGGSGAMVANSGTGAVTITGTLAQIQTMLAGGMNTVEYVANTNTPPAMATLSVTVDDQGNTGTGGALQDMASIPIVILSVNDAPVAPANNNIVVNEDSSTGPVVIGATDGDGDPLTYSIAPGFEPSHGSVTLNGDTFTYTPFTNENGADSFYISITDGMFTILQHVNVTINPVPDAPVAEDDAFDTVQDMALDLSVLDLLANDYDPDGEMPGVLSVGGATGGSVQLNGGTVTFTPNPGFTGIAGFDYTIFDSTGLTDTGHVTIEVLESDEVPDEAANQPPQLDTQTQHLVTLAGSGLCLEVNATDPEGDPLTYAAGAAAHGTVSGGANGMFTYTPGEGFDGSDSFEVTVMDDEGNESVQTVEVTVVDLADLPATFNLLTTSGFSGEIGGSGNVIAAPGTQIIEVVDLPGFIDLSSGFNAGGDAVVLPGVSSDWSVVLVGSDAVFTDGDTFVSVPVGPAGIPIAFDDATFDFFTDGTDVFLGDQLVTEAMCPIDATPDGTALPGGLDADAMATLIMFGGNAVTTGGDIDAIGTNGAETYTVLNGYFDADASTNKGGDMFIVDEAASDFAAMRVASSIVIEGSDTTLDLPIGTAATMVSFDGDTRVLIYDAMTDQVMLGADIIGNTSTPLSFP